MVDVSDKENLFVERQDPRLVTFHFCEKYAKKSERRVKTEAGEGEPRMVRGSRITLVAKGRPLLEERGNQQRQTRKLSNFEILKRKISYLETEQFLGDKSQRQAQTREERHPNPNPELEYLVTGEFAYSKRITVLEKYRQNIKNIRKDHEKRKGSLNLIVRAQGVDSSTKIVHQPQAHLDADPSEWQFKKREIVSQCAKRYFRPQSLNRSRDISRFGESVAEVKGRRVEQSARAL